MKTIEVTSEIGELKKVLLHRPGDELLNLTQESLGELLFDDIPYLARAREEHDNFARILRENGAEPVYLEDLMAETLDQNPDLKAKFLKDFVKESEVREEDLKKLVYDYLMDIEDNKELVLKTMSGIRYDDLEIKKTKLEEMLGWSIELLVKPLANLYFTRDPFATIGTGVVINKMGSDIRNRETIYAHYILNYHKDYKDKLEWLYTRDEPYHIEGGDILNLNESTLAVGISERTEARAITRLAENIFYRSGSKIEKILAIEIPNKRAFMHLDTVFTQVDRAVFTVHPGIFDQLRIFTIEAGEGPGNLKIEENRRSLKDALSEVMGQEAQLILCGGGDPITADREQWNDGSNTLCISPGTIVVYERNVVTNKLLKEKGLNVIEMPGSELVRGRGGPRCMSMSLVREAL